MSDPFEFERFMGIARECAGGLPDTQDYLVELLNWLIADTLLELTGPKFDGAKGIGDLDDASGIGHLLVDYPGLLYVEEEAAAHLLLQLYLARDSLMLGFGLPPETMQEIELYGGNLIAWRLHGPAFKHDQHRKKESAAQSEKASKTRKRTATGEAVTPLMVQEFAAKWKTANPGRKKGLLKAIWAKFGMTSKTAHIYLNKNGIAE